MQALGLREDWEDLRVSGALLAVGTELFTRPGVHYLSGFYGPFERVLRDAGANIGFAPADFRRFAPLLEEQAPRVMTTVAAPPDGDGWCSLSLHVGGSGAELRRAGADPDRLLIVEVSERLPRTVGLPPEHRHALHLDEIDVLVRSDAEPLALARPAAERTPTGRSPSTPGSSSPTARPSRRGSARSRRTSRRCSRRGTAAATASTPRCSRPASCGCTRPARSVNRKGQFDGVSVTTFAFGTEELYGWLDGDAEVAFLPVSVVNDPDVIGRNAKAVTVNGALAIDIHGQVVARHDRRRPVLGHRRARGLRLGPGAVGGGALAAVHAARRSRSTASCAAGSRPGSRPAR